MQLPVTVLKKLIMQECAKEKSIDRERKQKKRVADKTRISAYRIFAELEYSLYCGKLLGDS